MRTLFFNPGSIFYLPYLMCAVLLTLLWLKYKKIPMSRFFSKKVWLSRQALVDFGMTLIVLLVMTPWLGVLQKWVISLLDQNFFSGGLQIVQLPAIVETLSITLITMLAYDLATYIMHRWMHENTWLWRIHSFHHSAKTLSFFTTYRQNPIEPVLLALVRSFFVGLSLLVFHTFVAPGAQVMTVMGMGLGFFLYMFTVNLHHSPVSVIYPKIVSKVFISPHVHHLHHKLDGEQGSKNFGVIFSIWDRLFGTYYDDPRLLT